MESAWSVIEEDKNKKGYVIAKCVCGQIKSINKNSIKRGTSKSCGCLFQKKVIEGKKYGILTACTKQRGNLWECECLCGNKIIIEGYKLYNEQRKSCGQCNLYTWHKDMFSNKKFGMLLITGFSHEQGKIRSKYYNYLCDCGATGKIISTSIGRSLSCGCYRDKKEFYNEISGTHYGNIRYNALYGRKKEIEFNVTQEYIWDVFIKQNRRCAITNTPIFFGKKKKDETTASLDRIDSTKGYIEGNVQWVHKNINLMKKTLSDEDFRKWFDETAECYIKHKREQEQDNNA